MFAGMRSEILYFALLGGGEDPSITAGFVASSPRIPEFGEFRRLGLGDETVPV